MASNPPTRLWMDQASPSDSVSGPNNRNSYARPATKRTPTRVVQLVLACLAVASVLWNPAATAQTQPIRIYLDADFTVASSASVSIERGLLTTLSEIDYLLEGRPVELVRKDHHGSSPRSKRHLEQFLADESALAVISGLHSPPLLAHKDFINEQGILVLNPWAAAGPITRSSSPQNWIFRLSVDDTKAGQVIVRHALETQGIQRPFLLLENTGWGKSNERTMNAALKAAGVTAAGVAWFNWNLNTPKARALIREVADSSADVIFLVANAAEAQTLIEQMIELDLPLPIDSHWGITGGNFADVIDASLRQRIQLSFIQTRFSFISHPEAPLGKRVLRQAKELFPGQIRDATDIEAPTGFIHAYDLMRILIAAVRQAGLTGEVEHDRRAVRDALEDLDESVEGLVKTYVKPFGVYDADHPDAHEALSMDDLVMARYGNHGEIILITEATPQER
jgi:branched-chain amino acid transport system substrate-binding protein